MCIRDSSRFNERSSTYFQQLEFDFSLALAGVFTYCPIPTTEVLGEALRFCPGCRSFLQRGPPSPTSLASVARTLCLLCVKIHRGTCRVFRIWHGFRKASIAT